MSLLNLAGFLSSNLGAFMTHLLEVNEAETWIPKFGLVGLFGNGRILEVCKKKPGKLSG